MTDNILDSTFTLEFLPGLLLACFVLIAGGIILWRIATIHNPYKKRIFLLSRAEANFFNSLSRSIPREVRIFVKVRVADVIDVRQGVPMRSRFYPLARIAQKHFDFVLCDYRTSRILAAIELDDSSHSARSRNARDRFLNRLCRECGLPLLRISAARYYDFSSLRMLIFETINK